MWRVMRARMMVFARESTGRDRLRAALEACGAEVLVAEDDRAAARALGGGRIDGLIVDLDPSPRASGLALLLAAQERVPSARRVLVVDGHAPIADAAFAAGLADRVLEHDPDEQHVDALAEWLVTLCDHAPRRGSVSLLAGP